MIHSPSRITGGRIAGSFRALKGSVRGLWTAISPASIREEEKGISLSLRTNLFPACLALAMAGFAIPLPAVRAVEAVLRDKSADNGAAGASGSWDLGGTDLAFKARLGELWVLDGHSGRTPAINAFTISDLKASPRRIALTVPPSLAGASALGLAEVPHGDLAGLNLLLFDRTFGNTGPPDPYFIILGDDGQAAPGTGIFRPTGIDSRARLTSIAINPLFEEVAAYDAIAHSFYLLDFAFAAISGPHPLTGFQNFFVGPWYLGTNLEGSGTGIAYHGPDRLLAVSSFLNAFESRFVIEYDLARGGEPGGLVADLSAASTSGLKPGLTFIGLEQATVEDEDRLWALNLSDDSLYAFSLPEVVNEPPAVANTSGELLADGRYHMEWYLDPEMAVDSIRIIENGVQVARLGPGARSYTSAGPLLGGAALEAATERAGVLSTARPMARVGASRLPPLPGAEVNAGQFAGRGDLSGIAVTKTPAQAADFRGYVLGLTSNTLFVFDHRLKQVGSFQPNPPAVSSGQNLAAIGVAIVNLGGVDTLAILDPDGPANNGVPAASFHVLKGAQAGQMKLRIPAIDMSALDPIPELYGWDFDGRDLFVAGGVLTSTGERVLVRLAFDGQTIRATDMAPSPFRALTPFAELPLAGIGVSILPSGNLLVAGSDTFGRTTTEALLLTPFSSDPEKALKIVGYAQGLPQAADFLIGFGPTNGMGPEPIYGLASAYFPPQAADGEERPAGFGVTYLPTGKIDVLRNPSKPASTLSVSSSLVVEAENRIAHPLLLARQLLEEPLGIPPGEEVATAVLPASFERKVAAKDFYYWVLNRSRENVADLSVEVALDGVPQPAWSERIVAPAGRYFRRALTGLDATTIRVRLRNEGTGPADLKLIIGATAIAAEFEQPRFRRGDCDGSGSVGIGDVIFGLGSLFGSGVESSCPDACDVNDDGAVDPTDMIDTLNFLFLHGPRPEAPGPTSCGVDPTATDSLKMCEYESSLCP
jgi:hypothetical protein